MTTLGKRLKTFFIGGARNPRDPKMFHKLSLIAFFAWVGLGADGITSSCYGPDAAFRTLGQFGTFSIFVGLGSVITIFIISSSYHQIVELFPTGGGGYLVAGKLLSPKVGMISGCALIIDYLLTITLSIASGADAIFSFLPPDWMPLRIVLAVSGVVFLTLLNLRGVKESVVPLIPIFLLFILTHAFAIVYAIFMHSGNIPAVVQTTVSEIHVARAQLGMFGTIILILRAYSMGAGTFTGIEAVSNGLPILREPKVQTAKRTMSYMAFSLAFIVIGLMLAYTLYDVKPVLHKTLNAVLFEGITRDWAGNTGRTFVLIILVSEAVFLFVAAQTGFLDGPRVLSNMAIDRWFPTRFSMLSDRLVTQNGILLMGGAALVLMLLTHGSVRFLVVLYSINVFITFVLSQLGMVRHWWNTRREGKPWRKNIFINSLGLVLTSFILLSVIVLKFNEGGWITLFITGGLVCLALVIRHHYDRTNQLLKRLDDLVSVAESEIQQTARHAGKNVRKTQPRYEPGAKTAILLVNGFTGFGLHTLFNIIRLFGSSFKNFIFIQIAVVDAGIFRGVGEVKELGTKVKRDLDRYVEFVNGHGYHGEAYSSTDTDVIDGVTQLSHKIMKRFPNAVIFGGQLVFPKETFFTRILHNYTIFSIQRKLYHEGIPVVILPIRVT